MPFKLLLKPAVSLLLRRSIMALAALLMVACAEQVVQPQAAYTKAQVLTQKAEQSLQAARGSSGPDKALHLLDAAQSYQKLDQTKQTAQLLKELDNSQLSLQSLARYTLLYAPILLNNHEHFRAREQLIRPRLIAGLTTLPTNQQIDLRRQRGDLFSLLGEDNTAVTEYVMLSELLSDPTAIQDTHNKIWQILNRTPDNRLLELAKEAQAMALKGWYQLALSTRSFSDISLQQEQIEQWRRQWPTHPAIALPPSNLGAIANAAASMPSHVALLVPLSGNYGEAGTVIRNGFLATYYDTLSKGGEVPSVHIYDTAKEAITGVYQQAVAGGANIVIGPLRKENLAALSMLDTLPVPVIGLNYLDQKHDGKEEAKADANFDNDIDLDSSVAANSSINSNTNTNTNTNTNNIGNTSTIIHNNLYQFGLSIADEARQVSERAWLEGHRSALAITPATGWGERALTAFSEHWISRGGKLVTTTPYSLRQSDFTDIIKPALLIDQSEQRAEKLQRTLGKRLEHNPRRRHDIDMVFLIAQPAQGRSIKPTLDFYYAHNLPVYATSHIYAGTESLDMNRDLEGIRFSAMPWTLPGMVPTHLMPDRHLRPSYRHLYTLGIDAYLLYQHIALMQASPQTQLFGHTGTLTLSTGNNIRRTQPWAEFKGNRVRPAPQMREY